MTTIAEHVGEETVERLRALAADASPNEEATDMTHTATAATAVASEGLDEDGCAWVEVVPTAERARNGDFYFTVTRDDLNVYAQSIRDNAGELHVDRDHCGAPGIEQSTRAAGWFTGDAVVVDAGERNPRGEIQEHASVWAKVKWTPTAQQEIRDGDYRFISAEFAFRNRDRRTGLMTVASRIKAATLTNRPFFRHLAPVTAAEIIREHGDEIVDLIATGLRSDEQRGREAAERILASVYAEARTALAAEHEAHRAEPAGAATTEGGSMSDVSTALLERLNLPEDATAEQALAKLDEELAAAQQTKSETPDDGGDDTPGGEEQKQTAELAQAAASDRMVQVDREQLEELKRAADLGRKARLQQVADEADRLVTAAKKDGRIAPASAEAWRAAILPAGATELVETEVSALASLAPGRIPVDDEIGGAPSELQEEQAAHASIMSNVYGLPTAAGKGA